MSKALRFAVFAGVVITAPLFALEPLGLGSNGGHYAVLGTTAYFNATDHIHGKELWKTDGTTAGTMRVTNFADGGLTSPPFVHQNQIHFFTASALWKTDGTPEGTQRVLDVPAQTIRAVSGGSFIVFVVSTDTHVHAVWRTDGTPAGTFALGFDAAVAPGLGAIGNRVYFVASSFELWTTDGTPAGTVRLSLPAYGGVVLGTRFLFTGPSGLGITDGTNGGTIALGGPTPRSNLALHGGTAYYLATDALWRTDGTAEGTVQVASLPAQSGSVAVLDDGRVFIGVPGRPAKAYLSDGTAAGTAALKEWPTRIYGFGAPVPVGSRAFFGADEETTGAELWSTDGTAGGTGIVRNINSRKLNNLYPIGGGIRSMTPLGDGIVFFAEDGIHGSEPWISDGTEEGTRLLKNIETESEIRGTVIDAATGAPILGAKIDVYYPSSDGLESIWVGRSFETDADGHYVVEGVRAGRYSVSASKGTTYLHQTWDGRECAEGCDPAPYRNVADHTTMSDVNFALRIPATISGRVMNSYGQAVVARVAVGPAYGQPVAQTWTKTDGTYSLALPPDPFVVYIKDTQSPVYSGVVYPDVYCSAGCAATAGTRFSLASGESRSGIDLLLKRRGKIRGTVKNQSGIPIQATVKLYPHGSPFDAAPAATGNAPAGSFEIDAPDGPLRMVAFPKDAQYDEQWYSTAGCERCKRTDAAQVTAPPETTVTYDIVVPDDDTPTARRRRSRH